MVYNRLPLSTVESKMPKVKYVKIKYVPGKTPVYYPGSLFTSPLDADHPLVRFLRNQRPRAGPWNANIAEDLGHGLLHTVGEQEEHMRRACLLYTSPSPRDLSTSRMPSSA